MASLPPSCAPTSSHGRATIPVPPLAPAGVDRAARSRAPAGSLPEQGIPRLAAAAAVVRLRRRHHRPNLRSKSSLGIPRTTLRPLPPGQGRWPRRNCAAHANHRPGGPHCKASTLFEGLSANRGHIRKESKLSGTSLQTGFLNSACVWLKLVKCVDNCTKL
jgi:hypothetical protein